MPSFLLNISSKKVLGCFFVLVVMIGILNPVNNVLEAQTPTEGASCTTGSGDDGTYVRRQTGVLVCMTSVQQEAMVAVSEVIKNNDGSCGLTNIPACGTALLILLAGFILHLAAFVLWLSGSFLDFVISFTVLDMKAQISGLTGINIGWKVIRDLMNIAFIFILVYEGIKMIIGLSDLTKIKRFVSMVVLASLLVNFSLFFTKVMIDASNIITIGIYNSMIDNVATSIPGQPAERSVSGLSSPFMRTLGLQSFYSANGLQTADENKLILFIMGSVVFIIVAFVFFAISIMFVVRYITLIILLMLSPVAYMGMALPFIKPYADQWWKALNSQLIFAPVYMIMTSVVLTLMSSPKFVTSGDFTDLAAGNGSGSISLLLNFAIIIGLTITTLVIAKKTSTDGSSFIKDATSKFTAFAGGAVMGGAAMGLRRTVGAGGNAMANDQGLKDRAAGIGVGRFGQIAAQAQLKAARKAAGGSYDVRRSGIGEQIASATGVSLGKGTDGIPFMGNAKAGEGGYKKEAADKVKKEKEYYDSLKVSDADKERARIEAERYRSDAVNGEEGRRIREFDNNPEYQARLADKIAAEERAGARFEAEKVEAENMVAEVNTMVTESQRKVTEMEEKIRNAANAADKTFLEGQMKREVERQAGLKKNLVDATTLFREKTRLANDATNAAQENIKKIKEAAIVERNQDSKEMKALDELATGKTQNDAVAKAYSEELIKRVNAVEQQTNPVMRYAAKVWNGNPETNLAASAQIRSSLKKKTAKELMEEVMKATGEIAETPATPAPAPTPAPVPPTPPAPPTTS